MSQSPQLNANRRAAFCRPVPLRSFRPALAPRCHRNSAPIDSSSASRRLSMFNDSKSRFTLSLPDAPLQVLIHTKLTKTGGDTVLRRKGKKQWAKATVSAALRLGEASRSKARRKLLKTNVRTAHRRSFDLVTHAVSMDCGK